MNRRATRWNHRDAIEPEIIAALKKLGIPWYSAPPLDGWAYLDGWTPVELKTGKKGRLTLGQKAFISECALMKRPYFVWRSTDDLLKCLSAKEIVRTVST